MIRDVRGREFPSADPVKDHGMSQSEIVASLRGAMSVSRPYTLEQLIHDIEALEPDRLDTWALRRRAAMPPTA